MRQAVHTVVSIGWAVHGRTHSWTKGFSCGRGEDVVGLLREAIARRGDIKTDVAAILNDTTGCLMACAWKNQKCRIGMIIRIGSNACYIILLVRPDVVTTTGIPKLCLCMCKV